VTIQFPHNFSCSHHQLNSLAMIMHQLESNLYVGLAASYISAWPTSSAGCERAW